MSQPSQYPQRQWFGREPALVIQGIGAILTALVAFGLPIPDGVAGGIVAALTATAGFVTALYVRPIAPSIANGLIASLVALVAAFGVDVPAEWVGAAVLVVSSIVTVLTRGQQSPVRVVDGKATVIPPAVRSADPVATAVITTLGR